MISEPENNEDSVSDSSDCSSEAIALSSRENKKPKKHYNQKYNVLWEKRFAWISRGKKGDNFFNCKSCNKDYLGGITEIIRHEITKKHKNNVKTLKHQGTIKNLMSTDSLNIKESEIRLTSFLVEHNIAFSAADHLPELIRSICPDSKYANKITLKRKKCTNIVKNVIGSHNFQQLCSKLNLSLFSLLVDESTDKDNTKHLCLVVRYFDTKNKKVQDSFLHMLPLSTSSTARTCYCEITEFFKKYKIDYKKNMIGFGSDGANAMMGSGKENLKTYFQNDIPDLFVLKCSCHSCALCASYACKKLPDSTEILLRDIYKYFKFSPQKTAKFKEFQTFCDLKPHKMLYPSQTRWLSLLSVVQRVLEQWQALKLFFQNEVLNDSEKNINGAESIHDKLQNIFQKMYLLFLDFILPYITNINLEMQSEDPKIFVLYHKVQTLFITICEMFISKECLKRNGNDHLKIDYRNPHNLNPIEKIYLGGNLTAFIIENNLPLNELNKFRITCLEFYQELLDQIKKRFPFDRDDLKFMCMLSPDSVMNQEYPSLIPLIHHFPRGFDVDNYNAIDREWRMLPNILNTSHVPPDNIKHDFGKFWDFVGNIHSGIDVPKFPLLMKFVRFIQILPHSSACVERIFSAVNLNKTKTRNCLGTKSLVGILHAKRSFFNTTCSKWKIEKEMLQKMNSKMYKGDDSD